MTRNPLHRFIARPVSLGLALAIAGLTGCSNRLDTSAVEATIKTDIERQGRRLSLKSVLCPSGVTRQEGAYFRCVGELNPEGTFTINVTQQDSQGTVTWDVPNSKALLNLPRVEETIQQELSQAFGKRSLIDCGSATYRVNLPGDRFQCQVVGGIEIGSGTVDAVLVRVDPEGNLNWQELQPATAVAAAAAAITTPSAAAADGAAPAPKPTIQLDPAVKTGTATSPTGRVINRPYIQGDND